MSNEPTQTYRAPAVSGLFYSDEPDTLRQSVQQYLEQARGLFKNKSTTSKLPQALILPHAGHIYSGSTAAKAVVQLDDFKESIDHVVILGPSHRVYFEGIAVPECNSFRTPLGDIPINQESKTRLQTFKSVIESDKAHEQEHSIEVQLPFLQCMFKEFSLTPLVVGQVTPQQCAEILEQFIDLPNTITLISSDLSHFLDYNSAKSIDQNTCEAILNLREEPLESAEACGHTPINGLLELSRHKGYTATLLGLCNSGDIVTDQKSRVVGYGAWRFDQ